MTTQQQMVKRMVGLGWSTEQAEHRAKLIFASQSIAANLAAGIEPLSHVAVVVLGHDGVKRIADGFVNGERRMQIDGVYGQNVVGFASRPFSLVGGDTWTIPTGGTRAKLADGTLVTVGGTELGVAFFEASGKRYDTVIDAAIALTPAVAE